MPKSILIVDDSEPIRSHIRQFLSSQPGYHVCGEATDGLDAIQKALELKPDVIIMDLAMPRMNGLQAARELRTVMTHVPIVLFTMHARAVPPDHAAQAGISAIVSKTEDLAVLAQHIEKLVPARNGNRSRQSAKSDIPAD
jgi:DNA-binding NarL/FixJ family response regulator